MTHYSRRDFLRALGVGAAVAVAPGLPKAIPFFSTGDSKPQAFFPVEFPWEFWGETELGPEPGEAAMEHATLWALQTEPPPDGFQFSAYRLGIGVREDARVDDCRKFLGWKLTLYSGGIELIDCSVAQMILGSGIGQYHESYRPPMSFLPALPIPINESLSISLHGEPFLVTGPPIKIQICISGVGVIQVHGDRPETADAKPGGVVANK